MGGGGGMERDEEIYLVVLFDSLLWPASPEVTCLL